MRADELLDETYLKALDAHDDPVVRARARELAHEWWWEDGEDSGEDG